MTQSKKVILDADVIIHFAKGDMLSILPEIMDDSKHIILDKVYNETLVSDKNFINPCKLYNLNVLGEFTKKGAWKMETKFLYDLYEIFESSKTGLVVHISLIVSTMRTWVRECGGWAEDALLSKFPN